MATYQITVNANPGQEWHSRLVDLPRFGDRSENGRSTVFVVDVKDDATLMQLLNEIHGHGIQLVSLYRIRPGTAAHAKTDLNTVYSH